MWRRGIIKKQPEQRMGREERMNDDVKVSGRNKHMSVTEYEGKVPQRERRERKGRRWKGRGEVVYNGQRCEVRPSREPCSASFGHTGCGLDFCMRHKFMVAMNLARVKKCAE